MRNRNVSINVRIDEKEKAKLQKNAKKSGLNLSAYLRKTGLKQEISAIPDKEFYKIYVQISNLKNIVYRLNNDEIITELEQIEKNFLNIYNSNEWVVNNGSN